jgi:hypothetical protein
MRRSFAAHAVPALLGLFACTHYGAADEPPREQTPDAGPGNDSGASTPTVEAGSTDGSPAGANDAGAPTCEHIIEQELDNPLMAGWIVTGNGTSFGPGPDGMSALKISLTSNGELQRSYLERTIAYPGIRSVHSEFDVAYDQVDAVAGFGCVTNLARSTPFGEVRLELSRDTNGLAGVSAFTDEQGLTGSEMTVLAAPLPGTWVHVTFELSVTSQGTIERKLDFGGQSKTMTPLTRAGSSTFDGVHVLCGVVGLQGAGASATIYLKSLLVTACRIPP